MVTKSELFDDFSKSLEVVTNLKGIYACPLCRTKFPQERLEELSREHIVPESLGGKKLVLSCGPCNQRLAQTVDVHLKKYVERQDFEDRYPESRPMLYKQNGLSVRVAVKGLNIELGDSGEARVSAPSDSIVVRGRSEIPQEQAVEFWTVSLDSAVKKGTWPGTRLQLEDDRALQYNMHAVRVGLLRSAYLAAFAALGYGYILQPSLDRIRLQILNPQERMISHFVMLRQRQVEKPRIIYSLVREPMKLTSLLVQFQGFDFPHDWSVFLPLASDKGLVIYDNLRVLLENLRELNTLIFKPEPATKYNPGLKLVDDRGKGYKIF